MPKNIRIFVLLKPIKFANSQPQIPIKTAIRKLHCCVEQSNNAGINNANKTIVLIILIIIKNFKNLVENCFIIYFYYILNI